ncbi:hypothetical protein LSH36_16g14093 [Paralvinella palmiformis]|uniref:Uncharacterized protein n=1 Tax=Paralvinella palmiformis TaxID=53620 RepID=A0AAD9NHL0_9ANNE|nr:hypothetical protein LSH36_16g14093 [Paralvinella palmiformis]
MIYIFRCPTALDGRKSARSRALLVQLPISARLNKVMGRAKHLTGTGHLYLSNCHLDARNGNSSVYLASNKRD